MTPRDSYRHLQAMSGRTREEFLTLTWKAMRNHGETIDQASFAVYATSRLRAPLLIEFFIRERT